MNWANWSSNTNKTNATNMIQFSTEMYKTNNQVEDITNQSRGSCPF